MATPSLSIRPRRQLAVGSPRPILSSSAVSMSATPMVSVWLGCTILTSVISTISGRAAHAGEALGAAVVDPPVEMKIDDRERLAAVVLDAAEKDVRARRLAFAAPPPA